MFMARKAKKRRYSRSASSDVESEMRRYKKGTARSGRGGRGGRVKSRKQAIAIGLSKARRAGVALKTPEKGTVSEETRKSVARDTVKARKGPHPVSRTRSRATTEALEHEGHAAASHAALAKQAHAVARRRGPKARSAAAKKAARTRARRRAHG